MEVKPDTRGYCKVKQAAAYAGISERTFEDWLKEGLAHHKLPTGTRLIAYCDIDGWLAQFRKGGSEAKVIADKLMDDLQT
jgi:excisionase family DNA binding protein